VSREEPNAADVEGSPEGDDGHAEPVDGLRSLHQLAAPDARMLYLAVLEGAAVRPLEQRDRYECIAELRLHDMVPAEVLVHYDTARNLYLFAWHVYRFHVVAEHQALASLEMALRFALVRRGVIDDAGAVLGPYAKSGKPKGRGRPAGLTQLLTMAARIGLITNEGLTLRGQWAQQLAEDRRCIEQIEFMERNGLDRLVLPNSPAVPTADDMGFDWLQQFLQGLPRLRNEYAHGSQMLHANVLRTFQIVCELINQLWPAKDESAGGS
tara:strand:- start:540 stop:1340 length:801 start_codon:yes stop_codon:yes gene_type:complete